MNQHVKPPRAAYLAIPFADLGLRQCKWIAGDPTVGGAPACGQRTVDGRPYCPHHAALAYESRPRRAA